MVEQAIDDIVWRSLIDPLGGPIGEYTRFTCKEVATYSKKKIAEYEGFVCKLIRIQEFIADNEMKTSLEPLINHHRRLHMAYRDVYIANAVGMPISQLDN